MLICEACGHENEGRLCDECGESSPAQARFCCHCGRELGPAREAGGAEPGQDPYDLDNRTLCTDDSCIGIINEEGVCSECGKPYRPEG
ncbi:MAG: hypothetical protein KKB20_20060 [Proteobacteria bacterium]|nr:hypothetical protein [Pseudomonadota bacterium]